MINHMKYLLLSSILFLCLTIHAQARIPCSIDFAQFKLTKDSSVVEMYYSLPDSSFRYKKTANNYQGELRMMVTIKNNLSTVYTRNWIVESSASTITDLGKKDLIGQKSFVLKPGQYVVMLQIHDLIDTTRKDSVKMNLMVRSFAVDKFTVSDAQLAMLIENEQAPSQQWNTSFKKSGLYVVPMPTLEYRGTDSELFTYIEIYNAKVQGLDTIYCTYKIIDAVKNVVGEYYIKQAVASDEQVEVFKTPISFIPSGVYTLQTVITSPKSTDSFQIKKKFYILNPQIKGEQTRVVSEDDVFLRSEFSTFSEIRCNQEFEKARYVATNTEIETYKMLGLQSSKQKFLFRFWRTRDTDLQTDINERYELYKQCYEYAQNNYTIQGSEGWRTDRGRVIMKYGKPTQIDRKYFSLNERAHEIWQYNDIQGGVSFIFVDKSGYDKYQLVHSTAMFEIKEERWYERYVDIMNNHPDRQLGKGSIR